jgi:hypothetical protein
MTSSFWNHPLTAAYFAAYPTGLIEARIAGSGPSSIV